AAAGAEDPRVQVEAGAFGEQVAGAGARDRDHRPRLRNIGDGDVLSLQRFPQLVRKRALAARRADDQPLVRPEPQGTEIAGRRSRVRLDRQPETRRPLDGVEKGRVAGVPAQVDLAAMGPLAERDFGGAGSRCVLRGAGDEATMGEGAAARRKLNHDLYPLRRLPSGSKKRGSVTVARMTR